MPDALRGLGRLTVKVMTALWLAPVQGTRSALLGDATYLGARLELIATRHTWNQRLGFHPHRHGLVTGGGVTDQGEWRAGRNGCLLPVRVVMAVFRGKWLAALDTAVQEGTRTRPDGMTRWHGVTLRHQRGRQQWHGHIWERYPQGAGVLTSVARYRRGWPIVNQR
jgi:Putative transposase